MPDPTPTDPVPSESQPLTAEEIEWVGSPPKPERPTQDTNILSLLLLIKATRTQVLSNQDREDAYESLLALQALLDAKDAEIDRLRDALEARDA